MPKSRPNPQAKSRKRRMAKEKLPAKAPKEGWNSAAKTVRELKRLSLRCWEFFLRLFLRLRKLGLELFRVGASDEKEGPSLSVERRDGASSSSAVSTPSGVSVPPERERKEQIGKPALETHSFGTSNDEDPCDDLSSTGNRTEALPLVIEGVISSNRVIVDAGGTAREDPTGFQRKDEAKFTSYERLTEIEDNDIKSELTGSESGYWKKKHDELKKERKIFDSDLRLRQLLSSYEESPEGKKMDDRLKNAVLELPTATIEKFHMILDKASSYTKTLRTMHFQRANMNRKGSFKDKDWRNRNHFPKLSDDDKYNWWEENFDREILEKRLGIMRVASKNLNLKLDFFFIVERVSGLNSKLHPQLSQNELNQSKEDLMYTCQTKIQTKIRSRLSGGNTEI